MKSKVINIIINYYLYFFFIKKEFCQCNSFFINHLYHIMNIKLIFYIILLYARI